MKELDNAASNTATAGVLLDTDSHTINPTPSSVPFYGAGQGGQTVPIKTSYEKNARYEKYERGKLQIPQLVKELDDAARKAGLI